MVLLAKRVSASVVESISISVSSASLSAITRPAMRWSSARVKRAPFSASAAVLSTDREDVFAPFERRARAGGDFFLVGFMFGFYFYLAKATPTFMSRKRVGDAPWPVPMVCMGWPLPQLGVPQSVQ